MAAREDRERDDLEARQSALYAVGCICDEEEQRHRRELAARARPQPSKETLALLADLALKQAEVMATELQFFAAHANRKVIKGEDVLLCARKLPAMARSLEKFQRETLGGSTGAGGKRRRRNHADDD